MSAPRLGARAPAMLLGLVGMLAAAPAAAQQGVIPLDSAVVAGLAPVRPRINQAGRLRFKTPWGTSVVYGPRLLPSGIGYQAVTDSGPHLRAPAFVLQTRGAGTWPGVRAGSLAGGLLGALLGSSIGGLACLGRSDCTSERFEAALVLGLLGVGAGALVGGVVGSMTSSWRTIYEYPEP